MKKVFQYQFYHIFGLLLLAYAAWYIGCLRKGFYDGSLWGGSTFDWFWLAILIPALHQLFVWFSWRTELHHGLMTKWLGQKAFNTYAVIFIILILARGILPWFVGYANRGTWHIGQGLGWTVSLIILVPVIYLMYSIHKYFSFRRALGIDHFDPSYRQKTLVRDGIFKYTDNAMYTFGLAFVYLPAFLFQSEAALVAGLFSHAAVWLHYFTTERPDMKVIYKSQTK